ncbi:hypothetical protein LJR034_008779 [Caballeronia sp. LjRoot34]|jgi:hypothetical protein|uniref:hypothetical protein n=1 Tax=Caballeronia sp. LjRoot34 TaxID=3342325 RepID=UPI003ECDF538
MKTQTTQQPKCIKRKLGVADKPRSVPKADKMKLLCLVRKVLQKWLLHPATFHWCLVHFPAFVEQAEMKTRDFLEFIRVLR